MSAWNKRTNVAINRACAIFDGAWRWLRYDFCRISYGVHHCGDDRAQRRLHTIESHLECVLSIDGTVDVRQSDSNSYSDHTRGIRRRCRLEPPLGMIADMLDRYEIGNLCASVCAEERELSNATEESDSIRFAHRVSENPGIVLFCQRVIEVDRLSDQSRALNDC